MSPNEGQPSSNSHGDLHTDQHPAEQHDFTPKPLPDGSRFARFLGLIKDDRPNCSPKPVRSQAGTIPGISPGPELHRNPPQEPMGPPPFPKGTGGRNRRFATDAEVYKGMKDMTAVLAVDTFAQVDTGYSPTGRRMVVVDESFYLGTRPHNHRPKPIREGAGKGPRKLHHFPRIRC